MSIPSILLILTALINLFLGIFIFRYRSSQKNSSLVFVFFTHAIVTWSFSMLFFRNSSSVEWAIFWGRVVYFGASLAALFFVWFALLFPNSHVKNNPKLIKYLSVLGLLGGLVIYLSLFTDFIISGADVSGPVNRLLYNNIGNLIFGVYVTLFFLLGFLVIARKHAVSRGAIRLQLRYISLGAMISLIIGFFNNFILTFNGNFQYNWVGPVSTLILVCCTGYAIVKYRFMDIRTVSSRIYTYILLALFSYSFFFFVLLIDEVFFGSAYDPRALLLAPFFSLFFATTFLPFFRKIQESSDVLFFKGYNPRSIIKDVALQFSTVINLNELIKILTVEFKKILSTEEVDVFLFENKKNKDNVCFSLVTGRNLPLGGSALSAVFDQKSIIVREELYSQGSSRLEKAMDRMRAKVIAPLLIRQKAIGFIVLGEKIEQDAYTKEDIDFLEIISSQAAVAIENARLYQEVDEFNKTLQQKVDEQTKEIRDKAEHLKKLMEMRSEFLDIASHQLRTPVTVIKGVLSMLEEGSIPPKKQKAFLRGAFEKSIKLGEIINDILRASEMDSERFEMILKPVDLNEILKKIKDDKVRTLETKKVKLVFDLPKEPLPPIMSNDKYIEQAIVNLINNSFQYTTKGSIILTAAVSQKNVIIRVADTGIGIPKEDLPKLFQKFARAENAVQTYTDGSGLGLFIIKQIIDATPGAKIEIERTEVGVGTTFALTLPRALQKS